MSKSTGNAALIQIQLDVVGWVTFAGLAVTTLSVENETIDVSTKGSTRWRELMESRASFVGIAGDGVRIPSDPATMSVLSAVREGSLIPARFISEQGDVITGTFIVVTFELTGEHKGAELFHAEFASAGGADWSGTATTPDGDLYHASDWASGQSGSVLLAPSFYLPGFSRFAGLVDAAKWLGFWDLTTAAFAQIVTVAPTGALTYAGADPPASFDAGRGGLLFNASSGFQYKGHANVTAETLTGFTIGMLTAADDVPSLVIAEVGPAYRNVEMAISGNATATYLSTVASPSGDEAFTLKATTDNAEHWVILVMDLVTKRADLYVDGALRESKVSTYAHASVSVGAAFMHAYNNQRCLVKKFFTHKTAISSAAVAAIAAGHMPDASGVLV